MMQAQTPRPTGGPALRTGKFFVDTYNLSPSLHRFWNAGGVMVGMYVGRQVMNWLVGQEINGRKVDKDEVPAPLRSLHGCLAYDHFSDDPKDRWMKVLDLVVPSLLAGYGGYKGSEFFFNAGNIGQANRFGTIRENLKNPAGITLETAEDAASMMQSKPWRTMSGFASMFGSASGFSLVPGPWNYGTSLGMSFLAAPRNKVILPGLGKFLTNTQSAEYPYGPPELLKRMVSYAVHNPDKAPVQMERMSKAILGAWFGESVTPDRVKAFAAEVHAIRDKFLREGGVPEHLKEQCEKELTKAFRGFGLEDTLKKIGLNPLEAKIGDHGLLSSVARGLGKEKEVKELLENYRKSYLARHPEDVELAKSIPLPYKRGSALPLIGTLTAGAGVVHFMPANNQEFVDAENKHLRENGPDPKFDESGKRVHRHGLRNELQEKGGVINGTPLNVAEWFTEAFNSPETFGKHRVMCAAGLTAGGIVGMKIAEALTGRTLSGVPIDKSKIHAVLKPLYKAMAYNPHSDALKDRWAQVAHYLIPAVTGANGVITASNMFFESRREKGDKAEFLEEYDDKGGMIQAGPWTGLTALTSVIATPSANVFLPFPYPNYGAALNSRFAMMAGREVILPGFGRFWTNNRSSYAVGSSKLLDKMIKYAVNNKDYDPQQLDEMAYGVLAPWFKNVSMDQVHSFVDKLHEVRDKYFCEGGVPEDYKKKCEKELVATLHGAGLEQTLLSIGLDPEKAVLGDNGFSGEVANFLGAKGKLDEMRSEYLEKYRKRKYHLDNPESPEPRYPGCDEKPAAFAQRIEEERNTPTSSAPHLSA